MDSKKAFEEWYATEGIRTPVPSGEHAHEYYQRIAFIAGSQAAMNYCIDVIDQVEKRLKKKES
jgi:hypothetical protein